MIDGDRLENFITRAVEELCRLTEIALREAFWQRIEHGWKAEPVICSFTDNHMRKSVRIIENGVVVFQQDVEVVLR